MKTLHNRKYIMGYSGRRVDTTAKISDQDRPFKSVDLVTEIVSAYVSKNPLPPAELPMLIGNIHAAVDNLARRPPLSKAAETATPAQIRKDLSYFGRFGKQGRGYSVDRLADELRLLCAERGLASYRPLIGTALPRRPAASSAKGVEYRP